MRRFTRRVENFVCEHCHATVTGNGYTNHCPNCLHSKHVDNNPGDRACECCGLMEPTGLDQKNGEFIIIFRCTKCSAVKRNKVSENDSREAIIALSRGASGRTA